MPDSFSEIVKVTRSDISVANVPARLEVPRKSTAIPELNNAAGAHSGGMEAVTSQRKRGRPPGSVDTCPRKKRTDKTQVNHLIIDVENPSHEIISDYSYVHKLMLESMRDALGSKSISENIEISMCYDNTYELMNRSSTHVDDIFAYFVAHEIIEHYDIEPRSVAECQNRADWPK
ncbi:hypothetical protein ACLB2K_029688 [Fragaria x ananassa]